MKIGDKVRLLKGKEQGIVTRFVNNKVVEVEIEDGFTIPVLKNELAVVAKEEADHFGEKTPEPALPKPVPNSPEGVFAAFIELNDRQLSLYLINNTSFQIPFTAGQEARQQYTGIASGLLQAHASEKIMELEVRDFKQWPNLIVQMLFHQQGPQTMRQPLVKNLKFRAPSFFKHKRKAPLIEKDAYVFQLDEDPKPIDIHNLKEKIFQPAEGNHSVGVQPPAKVIDLHIDKLVADHSEMSNSEMLDLQLKTFEQALDQAIASGMSEITFIHGIGNGTLKNALHKKLSQEQEIKYYKDAMKEKFGYGATLVRIN